MNLYSYYFWILLMLSIQNESLKNIFCFAHLVVSLVLHGVSSFFFLFILISTFERLHITLTDFKGTVDIFKEWTCWKKKLNFKKCLGGKFKNSFQNKYPFRHMFIKKIQYSLYSLFQFFLRKLSSHS